MAQIIQFHGQKTRQAIEAAREREQSVEQLVCEMETDAYVLLAKRTIKSKVTEADVSVVTSSPDPRAKVLAVTLDEAWNAHIGQMLECFGYGRAAFEIVKCAIGGGGVPVTQTVLRLEPLPYADTSPVFSETGQSAGMADGVEFGQGENKVCLERGDGWWLALDATSLNPYGQSRYVGAPEAVWRRRKTALERLDTFIYHLALPKTVIYAPRTRTDETGREVSVHDEIGEAHQNSRGGDLLIFPNEYENLTDGTVVPRYKAESADAGVRDGTPLLNLTDNLGSETLLALGIPPKTVIEGDAVGSFAMVSEQMKNLYAMVEDILGQIGQSFQSGVIDPVVAMNFGANAPAVTWTFVPITQRPDDLAVELVKAWLTTPALSPLVTSGQIDVAKMLTMTGIPLQSAERAAALVPELPKIEGPPVAQMAASFRHLLW